MTKYLCRRIYNLLSIWPKMVYLYLKVDQFQAFIESARLITTVAVQFCTPTNKKQTVSFPQILASMICYLS